MIVGTAGHIDHGKTALVKALTGVDADRLPEEKARGISIDLGFAYADLGDGQITGFVDVPGHQRLIHTMVAGAGAIDVALLVVAADDGVMPQTREHLAIFDLLNLRRAIVALTKSDLVDDPRRKVAIGEIERLLESSGREDTPIIAVSVVTGEGIEELREALLAASKEISERDSEGLFRFAVDRSFTLGGVGTVVTGAVLSGSVAIGDKVVVSPSGLTARVRGIHAQNRPAKKGFAGQRCALNIADEAISKDSVSRGDMIVDPVLHVPTDRIDAELSVLSSEGKAVGTWFPARLHTHSAEVGARIVPLGREIGPGAAGFAQLVLDRPIAAAVGDRFILRDVSAVRTIGGGRFLDLRAPARKRGTPDRLAILAAAQARDPADALRGQVAVGPVDMAAFLRDRALRQSPGGPLLAAAGAVQIGPHALSMAGLEELRVRLGEALATFHRDNPDIAGIGREKLRLMLARHLPPPSFLALLREERDRGAVVLDGAFVRLPSHEARMSPEDEALFERIRPGLLDERRFRPPRVRDFAESLGVDEKDVRRVLRLSQKLGRTDQIAHDHFFAREVTREMAGIIVDVAGQSEDGWLTAPAFRDRVQNGRKVAIEILDFFDRLGLTLRRGDLRRINPHRIDMFVD